MCGAGATQADRLSEETFGVLRCPFVCYLCRSQHFLPLFCFFGVLRCPFVSYLCRSQHFLPLFCFLLQVTRPAKTPWEKAKEKEKEKKMQEKEEKEKKKRKEELKAMFMAGEVEEISD